MSDEPKVTEKVMRDRIFRMFSPEDSVMNFNMQGIGHYEHEIDVLRILRSGYAQEFEIKVTLSDIKAELIKTKKHLDLQLGSQKNVGVVWPDTALSSLRPRLEIHPVFDQCKADMVGEIEEEPLSPLSFSSFGTIRVTHILTARYRTPIKEFYVAVPTQELAAKAVEILPAWMGVAVFGPGRWPGHWASAVVRKAAKLKNVRKATDIETLAVYRKVYYKFWDLYRGTGGTGRK